MKILKDLILVNKSVFKKTFKSFNKNWILFFTGLVYSFINIIVFNFINRVLIGPMGVFSGFISLIVLSGLISNYLYLLYNVINYNRITLQNFKDGFSIFLGKIYGVFFIGWIFDLLMSFLNSIVGGNYSLIKLIINISIVFLLNALPETIYIKSLNSMESISYSLDFIKDNFLNWYLPNGLIFLILYKLTGEYFGIVFNTHLEFTNIMNAGGLLTYILGQIVFTFGMIYRGHLYKLLSTSNRRKRMFMNEF